MENLTITKNRLARHPKLPKNDPFVSIISVQTPSQTPCLVRVPALRGISASFLSESTPKEDIAYNSGLNLKTISNRGRGAAKRVVLQDSLDHIEEFINLSSSLASESDLEVKVSLNLKGRNLSAQLGFTEALLVINALAVKRAAIRGGAWSSVGKQVEEPLMRVLCTLFEVPKNNYRRHSKGNPDREVDYFLVSDLGKEFKCEVKLMGKGNPESADAAFARETDVLIASTISDKTKDQLKSEHKLWVELQQENGFMRFGNILEELGITHKKLSPLDNHTDNIRAAIAKTLTNP